MLDRLFNPRSVAIIGASNVELKSGWMATSLKKGLLRSSMRAAKAMSVFVKYYERFEHGN